MSDTAQVFDKRMAELRDAISKKLAAVAPQRVKREALLAKQLALSAEIEALSAEVNAVSVADEKRELSVIAKALKELRS